LPSRLSFGFCWRWLFGIPDLQDEFDKRQESEVTIVRERKDAQARDKHEALSVPGERVTTMGVCRWPRDKSLANHEGWLTLSQTRAARFEADQPKKVMMRLGWNI